MPPQKPKSGTKKTTPEHSAGFVLFRSTPAGPLFLLLDYGKHWDYPKGHLEAGETSWQAAVRELAEETGITAVTRVPGFEREIRYHFFSQDKGRIRKTVTFFLAATSAESVTLSHEHQGHAWLPYEDALQRLTYPNARELLTAAHQALGEIVDRDIVKGHARNILPIRALAAAVACGVAIRSRPRIVALTADPRQRLRRRGS